MLDKKLFKINGMMIGIIWGLSSCYMCNATPIVRDLFFVCLYISV